MKTWSTKSLKSMSKRYQSKDRWLRCLTPQTSKRDKDNWCTTTRLETKINKKRWRWSMDQLLVCKRKLIKFQPQKQMWQKSIERASRLSRILRVLIDWDTSELKRNRIIRSYPINNDSTLSMNTQFTRNQWGSLPSSLINGTPLFGPSSSPMKKMTELTDFSITGQK